MIDLTSSLAANNLEQCPNHRYFASCIQPWNLRKRCEGVENTPFLPPRTQYLTWGSISMKRGFILTRKYG
jgi:hypothetical protein